MLVVVVVVVVVAVVVVVVAVVVEAELWLEQSKGFMDVEDKEVRSKGIRWPIGRVSAAQINRYGNQQQTVHPAHVTKTLTKKEAVQGLHGMFMVSRLAAAGYANPFSVRA